MRFLMVLALVLMLGGCAGVGVNPAERQYGVEFENGVIVDVALTADERMLDHVYIVAPAGVMPPVAGDYSLQNTTLKVGEEELPALRLLRKSPN